MISPSVKLHREGSSHPNKTHVANSERCKWAPSKVMFTHPLPRRKKLSRWCWKSPMAHSRLKRLRQRAMSSNNVSWSSSRIATTQRSQWTWILRQVHPSIWTSIRIRILREWATSVRTHWSFLISQALHRKVSRGRRCQLAWHKNKTGIWLSLGQPGQASA